MEVAAAKRLAAQGPDGDDEPLENRETELPRRTIDWIGQSIALALARHESQQGSKGHRRSQTVRA